MGSSALRESDLPATVAGNSPEIELTGKRTLTLGVGALSAAVMETACLLSVMVKTYAIGVGSASAIALGIADRVHGAVIRVPLLIFSTTAALANVYVLWRAWRIRKSPAAQWRIRPLTAREKRRIAFVLSTSLITVAVVAAEIFSHHLLHPGKL